MIWLLMAWYVILTVNPKDTRGMVTASTAQFANANAYQQATGADPAHVLPDAWQTSTGFSNQLEAAHAAAKFNALPADQKQAGSGVPLAPNAAAPALGTAANPLGFLKDIADLSHRLTEPQTWLRVAEFIVGGMLIYVGIKAVLTPGQQQALRSGKKVTTGVRKAVTKTAQTVTPTGRATRVITKHEARVKAQQTRGRATVIRGKQREFGRRELYR